MLLENYRSWDLTNEGDQTKVKKFLIKFEIFQSNFISVGNVFRTNFEIISGSVEYTVTIRKHTCSEEL